MSPSPLTYTVEEAAAALGVSTKQTYKEVRSGRIPHVRLGKNIRIPREGLADWVLAEAQRQAKERRSA